MCFVITVSLIRTLSIGALCYYGGYAARLYRYSLSFEPGATY